MPLLFLLGRKLGGRVLGGCGVADDDVQLGGLFISISILFDEL